MSLQGAARAGPRRLRHGRMRTFRFSGGGRWGRIGGGDKAGDPKGTLRTAGHVQNSVTQKQHNSRRQLCFVIPRHLLLCIFALLLPIRPIDLSRHRNTPWRASSRLSSAARRRTVYDAPPSPLGPPFQRTDPLVLLVCARHLCHGRLSQARGHPRGAPGHGAGWRR